MSVARAYETPTWMKRWLVGLVAGLVALGAAGGAWAQEMVPAHGPVSPALAGQVAGVLVAGGRG
ncbi:MAG: hypothetical protein ACI38U_07740 [Corynebacterium sp.]|uniref:hypothetical protein n=1 Tax=Corynebacterium sp. TaxID=1720 RepID=UPI003F0ADC98